MERGEVLRLAREAGYPYASVTAQELDVFERFAALVAGVERARMPTPPLVVDVSSIDPGDLADMMKRARPDTVPVLVPSPPTRKQHIDALVGDALTGKKADEICRDGHYEVTGVILTRDSGEACLVNRQAVRWLSGERDLDQIMFPNHRPDPVAEAVAAEREACCSPDVTNAAGISASDAPRVVVEKYRAAIRARGASPSVVVP